MRELRPCGTRAAYRRGCRCDLCVSAVRVYDRDRIRGGGKPWSGTGTCEQCGVSIGRKSKVGPIPRFCGQQCRHKNWTLNNSEQYKTYLHDYVRTPEYRARNKVDSARQRQSDPIYFSRLFWERKKKWTDYLGGVCTCGESRLPCLEFDHRDPQTKTDEVSRMLRLRTKYDEALIKEEVDKCDLLCANCHRLKTSKNWQEVKHLF